MIDWYVNFIGDAIREFAGECGIDFADDKNAVIDHLNYDANDDGRVRLRINMLRIKIECFVFIAYISCCKSRQSSWIRIDCWSS